MRLQYSAVPESIKVLINKQTPHDGGMSKRHSQLKELPVAESWNNLSNKINGFVLSYNSNIK